MLASVDLFTGLFFPLPTLAESVDVPQIINALRKAIKAQVILLTCHYSMKQQCGSSPAIRGAMSVSCVM